MKIVFNSQVLNKSNSYGISHYGWNLIETMEKIAPQNQYVCFLNSFRKKNFVKPEFSSERIGIKVCRIPNKLFYYPFIKGRNLFPIDLFLGKSDILHYLHPPSALPLQFYGKTVVTIHDLTLFLFPNLHTQENIKLYDRNLTWIAKSADRIIVDSQATQKDSVKYLNIPEEKIKVVHLAVEKSFQKVNDNSLIKETMRKYGIKGDYLLFMGLIEPRKNLKRLIEAYFQIVKNNRENLQLVIAGGKGWHYNEIFQKVKDLGLNKKIIFTGYVEDNERQILYSGAEVFIYPSLYEGFGLPVLEAMSCQIPVITSNISAMPEIVGEGALLIDPYSTEDLAKGIKTFLDNMDLRLKVAEKGYHQAQKFSLEKLAQETLKVYEETLNKN